MESNKNLGRLLDILGNETRRRILILLTRRPYFVSELSQELGVGQKAVLEHLRILESAGLIEGRTEKIPRGRPRKYYSIKRGFRLEVLLTPYIFGTEMYEPKAPEEDRGVRSGQGAHKVHRAGGGQDRRAVNVPGGGTGQDRRDHEDKAGAGGGPPPHRDLHRKPLQANGPGGREGIREAPEGVPPQTPEEGTRRPRGPLGRSLKGNKP